MKFVLPPGRDTGFNTGKPVWTRHQVLAMLKKAYEQGRKDAAQPKEKA